MKTSIQIYNRIQALRKDQAAVPSDAENREEQLFTIQGQIAEAELQLAESLEAEDKARAAFQTAGGLVTASTVLSMGEQAFGPRAEFKGLEPGFRAAITIPAGPGITDPSFPAALDYPRGFAETLMQAPTDGAVTFLRRGTNTNAAAQWKDADGAKAESSYVYTEATAPLTWIAHHTPIAKTEASDWGQLDAIVRGEMMVGLSQAKSRAALVGTNAAGIVGVINTVDCLTYTKKEADNVYDTIRRQATYVYLTSGFMPTHVAMTSAVKEELDLLKGDDGHYLAINIGDHVWGLQIVIDNGLLVTDTHVRNGTVVYSPIGATWYTKEADNVEIGLVNDQFTKNAYTLLAEGRNAMAVKYPDAFCYCQDAINAVLV
ncbi:MAG: phage major capsid protein [Actinomycetota bacterium]|jgi:hypothetical protein|nr:phage major capsid protein [Actinomycetota bacterium]